MLCYRLIHFFLTPKPDYVHFFDIGIYDSREKAEQALARLRTKPGFCLRPKAFQIVPVLRFKRPRLLNNTYWTDGFETCTYEK